MTAKVAVIVGSLRKDSVNRLFAQALARLARPKLDLQIVEIADLPLYNQDLEAELPAAVVRFKHQIESADAVLFVTPEFNRSFSAALKNAIEWGSRPWGRNSWAGQAVGDRRRDARRGRHCCGAIAAALCRQCDRHCAHGPA